MQNALIFSDKSSLEVTKDASREFLRATLRNLEAGLDAFSGGAPSYFLAWSVAGFSSRTKMLPLREPEPESRSQSPFFQPET